MVISILTIETWQCPKFILKEPQNPAFVPPFYLQLIHDKVSKLEVSCMLQAHCLVNFVRILLEN